jgi:hypothetical protein
VPLLAGLAGLNAPAANAERIKREAARVAETVRRAKKAVVAVVGDACTEDHLREWSDFWDRYCGAALDADGEGGMDCSLEGGARWFGKPLTWAS